LVTSPSWVTSALGEARVARLGTTDADGTTRLVPICFALHDGRLVSAVDHKPKRTRQLGRLNDIAATGRATALIDHYEEDWERLWWVRVRGAAAVHADDERFADEARAALTSKYPQYQGRPPLGPVYSVRLDELRWWRA
jgi:PPOX class probable F420-dependent enzyme